MPFFQHIFEPLPFKNEKKFLILNDFQKVGYYSGFYSSLNDEKRRNGEFAKNKVVFQCILRIWQKLEYTCNSENNFQTIAISSFLIAQRAVKSRIIANLLEIIKKTEFFSSLKGKG
jgi:hypothetical protein